MTNVKSFFAGVGWLEGVGVKSAARFAGAAVSLGAPLPPGALLQGALRPAWPCKPCHRRCPPGVTGPRRAQCGVGGANVSSFFGSVRHAFVSCG